VYDMSGEQIQSIRVPEQKDMGVSLGRRTLHAPDFPVLLLFSEKAGCTSLTKWFLFHVGKLDEATDYHPWIHRYRIDVLSRQKGYKQEAMRLLHSRDKPVVKLVRNPYSRVVSSFLSTLNNAHGRNSKNWAQELIVAARTRAGKPIGAEPALSFHDFVGFVAANGTERERINGHVARQHMAGEERMGGRIMKLEQFADDIRQLESDFGLAQSPLDLITRSHHHRSGNQNGAEAPVWSAELEITTRQIRQFRKGGTPSYDTLYDDKSRRLVRECFAADFEAYGYE
jgi:hypothetical protein